MVLEALEMKAEVMMGNENKPRAKENDAIDCSNRNNFLFEALAVLLCLLVAVLYFIMRANQKNIGHRTSGFAGESGKIVSPAELERQVKGLVENTDEEVKRAIEHSQQSYREALEGF